MDDLWFTDLEHENFTHASFLLDTLSKPLDKRTANYRSLILASEAVGYLRGLYAYVSFKELLKEDREDGVEPTESLWINYYILRNTFALQLIDSDGDAISRFEDSRQRQLKLIEAVAFLEELSEEYVNDFNGNAIKTAISAVRYVGLDNVCPYFNRYIYERKRKRTKEELEIFDEQGWGSLGQPPAGEQRTLDD